MSADHGTVAKELERANEEFKEFERKDIKYREDLKHLKAKLKKLQEKLSKDSAKMQVIAYVKAHSQQQTGLVAAVQHTQELFPGTQSVQPNCSVLLLALHDTPQGAQEKVLAVAHDNKNMTGKLQNGLVTCCVGQQHGG